MFDRCADCKRCCHVDEGYPALDVTLTQEEQARLDSICIEGNCHHLTSKGCALGETKPFSCFVYPLSYNPHSRVYSFDVECPLLEEYFEQLKQPGSEAAQHLGKVMERVSLLEASEFAYLRENHLVDSHYFELKKIPRKLLPRRPTK